MNENDSEKISGILEEKGYERTKDEKNADIIVINTCSVRENANNRFFGNLGNLKKEKEKRNFIVAVCGCMMQQKSIVKKIKEKYSFVDIIFGTHNIDKFSSLLDKRKSIKDRKNVLVEVLPDTDVIAENIPVKREHKHKAYVSIMKGCDNFCSYCIVPYTRGREKSRESENIIREIKGLAEDGVKEVTLLGQNVNSYGRGLFEDINFAKLLDMVSKVSGIERVRFMTSHPKDLTDDIIEVIADNEKIAKHIHLPVQSGSNRILTLMNRKYTREDYISLVEKIRSKIDGVSITTDIIVGFPSETEEDFLDTLDLYKKCRFESAFTFVYSKREGTKAAEMEIGIGKEDIKDRFNRLIEIHDKIMFEENKKMEGKEFIVLTEGKSKNNEDMLSGRTENFSLINFKGKSKAGDMVKVRVSESKTFHLYGEEV